MIANIIALPSANIPPAGAPIGLPSGPPPPISDETSSALNEALQKDPTGQSVPGEDQHYNDKGQVIMGKVGKPKTAKESMDDPAEPRGSVSR
jgi:hypothetical protein